MIVNNLSDVHWFCRCNSQLWSYMLLLLRRPVPLSAVKPSPPVNLSHIQTTEAELILLWDGPTDFDTGPLRYEVRYSFNTTRPAWQVNTSQLYTTYAWRMNGLHIHIISHREIICRLSRLIDSCICLKNLWKKVKKPNFFCPKTKDM